MSPTGDRFGPFERRPRLAGPGAPRPAGRRAFGATWWGAAWVEALEQRARLDPNRLPRGRTYARSGAVGELRLAPGEVLAEVQGTRRTPYKVRVRVRPFDAGEWDRVLDALVAEIGHTAALLDGELPSGVADDVAAVGLDLLPGPGELQPRCSCPDWADPCKHAAAVCYLVADALDADPFGVFVLRGRAREEVLAGLRARRHGGRAAPGPAALSLEPTADEGLVAREVFSRTPAALPVLPALPRRAQRPAVLAADPPPGSGIDLAALRALAADAAERALVLVRGGEDPAFGLSADEDLARRAAALLTRGEGAADPAALGALARRCGVPARELFLRALALRDGGVEGLAMLSEAWDPDPAALGAGRALLGPGALVRRNRVSLADRQLRLGRDGRWYPYRKDRAARWVPDGVPIVARRAEEVGALDERDEPDAPRAR